MKRQVRLQSGILLPVVLLAVLAWPVLLGFRRVVSPEPLARYLLLAAWLVVAGVTAAGAGELLVPHRLLPFAAGAVLRTVAGAGVLSLLASVAGLVGVLKPAVLAALAAVALAAGVLHRSALPVSRPWTRAPRLPATVLGAVTVVTGLPLVMDSAFYDQLNYHLAVPALWLRHARLDVIPGHDYTFLPLAAGALYVFALAGPGPWAAQALHWLLGALAAASAALLARGVGRRAAGWWAAALFAATPGVMLSATWAGNDLAAAAFAGLAWVAVLDGERFGLGGARRWGVAGFGVGLAVAAKATALAVVAVPVGVLTLLMAFRRTCRGEIAAATRDLALFAAGQVAAVAPWLVRNWLTAGDPLFPLVGGSFVHTAAPQRVEVMDRLLGLHLLHRGAAGVVGPAWALLLPVGVLVVLGVRSRKGAALGVATALGLAGWLVVPPLGRYLLPALVPAAALAGAGLASLLEELAPPLERTVQVLLVLVLAWGGLAGISRETTMRTAAGLGLMSRSEWLTRSVDYWRAAQVLKAAVPASARVLLVGEARTLYIDREVVVRDPFREPLPCDLVRNAPTPRAVARRLARLGVGYLLINHNEERRIARMTGRRRYLECLDPRGSAVYRGFLDRWTGLVYADRGVEVRRVRAP